MELIECMKYAVNRPELMVDLMDVLCGNYIGSGSHRDVFECNIDPSCVVKVERSDGNENKIEHEIWCLVSEATEYNKWFAPCSWISSNGRVMLQKKTKEKSNKKRPDKVPDFFSDIKDSNWGWIGNQFVCHDYATTLVRFQYRGLTKRMQKYEAC